MLRLSILCVLLGIIVGASCERKIAEKYVLRLVFQSREFSISSDAKPHPQILCLGELCGEVPMHATVFCDREFMEEWQCKGSSEYINLTFGGYDVICEEVEEFGETFMVVESCVFEYTLREKTSWELFLDSIRSYMTTLVLAALVSSISVYTIYAYFKKQIYI